MPENPRIEELRRRVEADSASIAFAALAEEYRRLGRNEEAVETCRAGLQRHPAYMSARVTLGRALIETGDFDAAREQFETVLRSAPENLAAIRGVAQIHERLGQSAEMDPHLAEMVREHLESLARTSAEKPAPSSVEGPDPSEVEGARDVELAVDLPLAAADVSEPTSNVPLIHTPGPAIGATLARLEHFLAAIQHARHA